MFVHRSWFKLPKPSLFYLFLERVEEREGEQHQCVVASPLRGTWPATQACALTGNRTCNPLVRSPSSIHGATPARATLDNFNMFFFFPPQEFYYFGVL